MKFLKTILTVILFLQIIMGCSSKESKKEIVTTIYPFKAILQEIVGNKYEVRAILTPGADPHTYEMLPSDYRAIQNSKIFFYGSRSLDGWASNLDAPNKIELLNLVPKENLKDIEIHHFANVLENDEHIGTDPHFWSDPLTVKAMLPHLINELNKIDPENQKLFEANKNLFITKLDNLDKKIKGETSLINNKNVFTGHPFYNYFFKRYGFNVVGSLEVAPGSQPTPKDIKNLIDIIKQNNVTAIFNNQQESGKSTKVLAEACGIKEYKLDPLGGVKGKMSYEEIILNNLYIIKEALK